LSNDQHQYFRVRNGYTDSTKEALTALKPEIENKKEAIAAQIAIGIQWDTQVVASAFGNKMYTGPDQIVTQAYCSAISISYSRASCDAWEPLAKTVLESAYEATLYAAMLNAAAHPDEDGAKRVFLTALGGGVFGNPMEWIVEAMWKAFHKFQNCNLEIYIVSFGRSDPDIKDLEKKWSQQTTP